MFPSISTLKLIQLWSRVAGHPELVGELVGSIHVIAGYEGMEDARLRGIAESCRGQVLCSRVGALRKPLRVIGNLPRKAAGISWIPTPR